MFTDGENGKPSKLQILQAERFCEQEEMFRLQNEIVDVVRARKKIEIPPDMGLDDLPAFMKGMQTPRAVNDQPYPIEETVAMNIAAIQREPSEESLVHW